MFYRFICVINTPLELYNFVFNFQMQITNKIYVENTSLIKNKIKLVNKYNMHLILLYKFSTNSILR